MSIFSCLALFIYVFEKAVHLRFEIMPISYLLCIGGVFFPIYIQDLYTVYENKSIVREKLNQIGFITFDRKKRYKGCNPMIQTIFPEVKDYVIGQSMDYCSKELTQILDKIPKTDCASMKRHGMQNESILVTVQR